MTNHCKIIDDTFEIKDNFKNYNSNKCFEFLEFQGKQRYGDSFKVYEFDKSTLYKLIIYMIKEQNTAQKLGIDLSKGILLTGPVGCGKTTSMQLLKLFSNPSFDYKIKSCRDISFDFAKQGFEVLEPFTKIPNNEPAVTPPAELVNELFEIVNPLQFLICTPLQFVETLE